jgi:hypothetical protein
MITKCALVPVVLLISCGCTAAPQGHGATQVARAVQVEVVNADEHFGHNINEGGGHSVWCDGCRTRILETGEPFVVYWVNNRIEDTPFQFSQGRRYAVWFAGEMGKGVMAYEGKCVDIVQVVKVEELDE